MRVGVTRTMVSDWNEKLNGGGLPSLRRRPRGRPPGLDTVQRRALIARLKEGALEQGFANELWTLPRVRKLIEQRSVAARTARARYGAS